MKIIKQLAQGNRDSMKSLSFELESLLYSCITEKFQNNWNSERITRSLFSSLKQLFHGKTVHTPGDTIKTAWHLLELKDNSESVFGDFALVVQISYHDGQNARGVVFYDTAEKDAGKNIFPNLHKNNYRRLLSVSPHSQLLLYDYDAITGMAFPSTAESVIGNQPHSWNNWITYTHAVSIPANLALTLDIKTTGLYKVALPLSYQICYRYLYGLDLDYNTAALETATGIKSVKGNPRYLVFLAVSHGGSEPPAIFDYNNKLYSEFE